MLSLNKAVGQSAQESAPAIHAELIGSNECTALGVTVYGYAPVLSLCRKLIETGIDPAIALQAYRGDVLCLVVRSIGEAAALEINGAGTGFRPAREPDAAPVVRQTGRGRA